jgi:hypothetical protein
MRDNIQKMSKIIDLSYLQLVVIFIVLALLEALNVISLPVDYRIFAIVVALFAIPAVMTSQHHEGGSFRKAMPILFAAFLFALVVRVIPYIQHPVPLGYDPGFYKYTFDVYASALPSIPEGGLAQWIKEMYPQGLFVFFDTMHQTAGTDSLQFMYYMFPLISAFLVFPIFLVTRGLFGQRAGLIAAVLYAVSFTQFEMFAWFYFKNAFGLMFLLFAIYALEKKKHGLMAVMFAALGIFHRPEFLLFALVLIPYFLVHRRKGIIFGCIGAALLILPFWIARWDVNWDTLTRVASTAATNIQTGEALGGGTFFGFTTYTAVALAYIPFALIGLFYLILKRNWNSLFFYFVINLVIVVFELFFFKRFIIPLDIVVIMLAALGIEYGLLQRGKVPKAVTALVVVLLVVAAVIPTVDSVKDTRPLITGGQIEAIEWVRDGAEEDAYVLAGSHDAPWVLGWSGHRVIAPGLFEWDYHTRDEWFDFFAANDSQSARDFLDVYDAPIYIYYARNADNSYLGFEKFENESFQVIYNDEDAIIYRYEEGD